MNSHYRQGGFSLIEILIVVAIFTVIIMAASQSFVPLLSQSKQQSKIAATNIEGVLGLEMLRRDIAHAGYGLYWNLDPKSGPTPTPSYTEVTQTADEDGFALNDAGIPRAIVIGGGLGLNGSDRIAVKAVNVATNVLSERWTYLLTNPVFTMVTWSPANENIGPGEDVIVVRPDQSNRYLHFTKTTEGQKPYSKYSDVLTDYEDTGTTSIVFSLGTTTTTTTPKMPFNRADYFIESTNVPTRCAAGTGVLYKAVVSQVGNGFNAKLSLLDCVADMQVGYRYDKNNTGYASDSVDGDGPDHLPLDALSARQVREVRIYILAQEGQKDPGYTHSSNIIRVGETGVYGRDFDLSVITNWQNYRWKLYTLIVAPICLLDWTVTP